MEIRNFKTFRAIVETGSFNKASKALNYAQSSVTAHIRAIEEFYGTPVFDRIGKKVILNDFGQVVFAHALKVLDSYEALCSLAQGTDQPSGVLRIGVPESTMLYRLHAVIRAYKERWPDVDIIMENKTCPQLREELKKGELDLALLLEQRRQDPEFTIQELITEEMGIVLPKEYEGETMASLQGLAVLYTEKGCSYRKIFKTLLSEAGISVQNAIETTSVEVIKRYITCGIGVSFLPLITIQDEIASGQVRCIPWKSSSPILLQLARHKDKWVTPAMDAFMQMVQDAALTWSASFPAPIARPKKNRDEFHG